MPQFACQFIVDPPQVGDWNMAADETMLDMAVHSQATIFRFYAWQEPTLSLGYFQPLAQRKCHPLSSQLSTVRRLSGGGAIVHDREITYSLALPATHPLARNHTALYPLIHQSLISTLQLLGIEAHLHCEPSDIGKNQNPSQKMEDQESAAEIAFLCFQRHCPEDVLIARDSRPARKILGSAQRRRRGAILQHGSLLLEASPAAPELLGIQELTQQKWNDWKTIITQLQALWGSQLEKSLQIEFIPDTWNSAQYESIHHYKTTKYRSSQWTAAR